MSVLHFYHLLLAVLLVHTVTWVENIRSYCKLNWRLLCRRSLATDFQWLNSDQINTVILSKLALYYAVTICPDHAQKPKAEWKVIQLNKSWVLLSIFHLVFLMLCSSAWEVSFCVPLKLLSSFSLGVESVSGWLVLLPDIVLLMCFF